MITRGISRRNIHTEALDAAAEQRLSSRIAISPKILPQLKTSHRHNRCGLRFEAETDAFDFTRLITPVFTNWTCSPTVSANAWIGMCKLHNLQRTWRQLSQFSPKLLTPCAVCRLQSISLIVIRRKNYKFFNLKLAPVSTIPSDILQSGEQIDENECLYSTRGVHQFVLLHELLLLQRYLTFY